MGEKSRTRGEGPSSPVYSAHPGHPGLQQVEVRGDRRSGCGGSRRMREATGVKGAPLAKV